MATKQSKQSAFSLETRDDGVAVVRMDVPGEAHNVLKAEFADDFEALFEQIRSDSDIKALVFASAKPGSFLAGADIKLFDDVKTTEEVTDLAHQCQGAFQQIEDLNIPVVAAIDGACLGGGLELALACDARIATDTAKTSLGLPEVMLGLLPAGGGTQRLPALIGIADALDLMLNGKQLRAAKAKKAGIVDTLVGPEALIETAVHRARELARGNKPAKPGLFAGGVSGLQERATELALEENPAGRWVLFDQARKKMRSQTKGNYPAPERIIDAVETGANKGPAAGFAAEAEYFGELVFTDESAALRHVYRATEDLKKATFAPEGTEPRPVNRVGVLGAGLMGAGIATVTIDKANLPVRLKDKDDDGLAAGMAHLRDYYRKRVQRKAMSRFEADVALNRVTGTTDYRGFESCDLVVEAVFEDVGLKHRMLADIEANARADTIFASNTSSIPITEIAQGATRPENVIGLHYFSPVEKMPLLEIITTEQTAPEVVAASAEFGKAQGKTVIVVRDGPGFYTTRVLAPFLNEATRILAEGVPVEAVDKALTDYGFPVGPMTLLDEVGIDIGTKVGPILEEAFGERMAVPGESEKMIEAGWLGRKAGKGFYDYEAKKKDGKRPVNDGLYELMGVSGDAEMDATRIAERCTLMFLNEAAYCLQDGILSEPMHGDIGAIFGLGFPPFTGGPFRYADRLGIKEVVAKLEGFAEAHGERFAPAPILKEMAKARAKRKQRFYP